MEASASQFAWTNLITPSLRLTNELTSIPYQIEFFLFVLFVLFNALCHADHVKSYLHLTELNYCLSFAILNRLRVLREMNRHYRIYVYNSMRFFQKSKRNDIHTFSSDKITTYTGEMETILSLLSYVRVN